MTVCSMTRSKVKVTGPSKSEKSAIFERYLLPIYNGGWQMTTDSYITGQYLKLIRAGVLIFILVVVSRDFEVGSK